jgi:predicted flap endonuclease-1-like 5' DNA nuclease
MTFFLPETDGRPAAADPFRFALTAEPFGVFPKMFQDMLEWQMAASGAAMKMQDDMLRFWFSGVSGVLASSEGMAVTVKTPTVTASVVQLRPVAKSAPEPTVVEVAPTALEIEPDAAPIVDAAGDFDDASVVKSAPKLLAAAEGTPDDLQIIKGIGPKLERLLHDLGVWHFHQIASWTPGEIAWINSKLDFKGRVQREKWVAQARALAAAKAA